ncbi:MAG: NfeD family protein [Betaproteobacteria bacterium]|nr:NfeD family protein [Betaproteobacteria bacterium]
MAFELAWLLVGVALVILELMTGTFYLLLLGGASLAASVVAWLGHAFWLQAGTAGSVALIGVFWLARHRRSLAGRAAVAGMDVGQPATFETWLDKGARLARVRYRGATWDAMVDGEDDLSPGRNVYVKAVDGNRLGVSVRRP